MRWEPIDTAPRKPGVELLGVRYAAGRMVREPFITFWSPTLGKFYCEPTHWMSLPESPL